MTAGLPFHTRCGVADLRCAVVVDGKTANDRIDLVAVTYRFVEALQQHHGATAAENGALRIGIESAAVTIRRHHAAVLVVIATLLRKSNRNTSRQGHVALIGQQTTGMPG